MQGYHDVQNFIYWYIDNFIYSTSEINLVMIITGPKTTVYEMMFKNGYIAIPDRNDDRSDAPGSETWREKTA